MTPNWAVDDVYIGVACKDFCSGHGQCDYPLCICDTGHEGDRCYQTKGIQVGYLSRVQTEQGINCGKSHFFCSQTSIKDDFESNQLQSSKWSLIQGGSLGHHHCMLKPSTNHVLAFTGRGQKMAVSREADLRNARSEFTSMSHCQSLSVFPFRISDLSSSS